MQGTQVLARWWADLTKVGLAFTIDGIKAKLSRKPRQRIRLPGGTHAFVRPGGSDFGTLRAVFRDHHYRLPDGQSYDQLVRKYTQLVANGRRPIIVDAGANIGAATLFFSQLFPKAFIVALEPDAGTYGVLKENTEALDNVKALEAALGGARGHVSVITRDFAWGNRTERSDKGCLVLTIDDVIAMAPDGDVFIVKIDIEGFESDVFAGDTRWMDKAYAVFVEPHDWMLPGQGSSTAFQREFGKRDFEIHMVGDNLLYLRPERSSSELA